jgi:hypothetical protein
VKAQDLRESDEKSGRFDGYHTFNLSGTAGEEISRLKKQQDSMFLSV